MMELLDMPDLGSGAVKGVGVGVPLSVPMNVEDLFISMLKESINDLRSGKLHKGKFIGKYMAKLKEIAGKDDFRYKHPQVVGSGNEANNNWLDYMLGLTDEEFEHFKIALTT